MRWVQAFKREIGYRLSTREVIIIAIDLSEHTMIIHNRISISEAQYLCKLYGKSLSKNVEIAGTDIKIAGINQINIKGNKIPESGIWTYDVKIMVNVGRLIKQTKAAMLVLNKQNVKAILKRLDEIFTRIFMFNLKHRDSSEWYIERLDCGIDLKLCTDEEDVLKAYIKALHNTFDSNNSRGVRYTQYKGYDAPEVQYESLTLETAGYQNGNRLYKYNIYYKLLQLKKHAAKNGLTLSPDEIDEIKNVIRIEKQIDDVSKVFGCSNKLGSLQNEDVTEKVMNNIIKEIKLFFGTGDYLTYDEGIQRIFASNYDQQTKNEMGAVYAYVYDNGYSGLLDYSRQKILSQGGAECDVNKKYKEIAEIRKCIEALNMSIVAVHDVTSKKGISTLLDEELKARAKPRKKHKFCDIKPVREPSGGIRYACKPTLYRVDGTKNRTTIASHIGGTREECEIKIFEHIRRVLNDRYFSLVGKPEEQIECCECAYEDYSRFRTIVKSKTVIADIDQMLNKISERIIKKQEERLYE